MLVQMAAAWSPTLSVSMITGKAKHGGEQLRHCFVKLNAGIFKVTVY